MKKLKSSIQKDKMKKMKHSLYAKVDWDKASLLFQRPLTNAPQKRFIPATKELLHVLAAAGAVGLVFAFPGAAVGIGAIMVGKNSYSRWGTKKMVDQLKKQKYVSIKEKPNGETMVTITKNGMRRALVYQLDSMKLEKPKRWDKKWRVVIFDIPERHKKLRNAFRVRLRQMGLYALQKSVYVSPYPCFSEIEFLRELYGVAFDAQYMVVEKLENDDRLLRHFDLI